MAGLAETAEGTQMARRIEERLTALEQAVAKLQAALAMVKPAKGWRKTVGMFTGDDTMKEIDQQMRKARERERAKVRRNSPRTENWLIG